MRLDRRMRDYFDPVGARGSEPVRKVGRAVINGHIETEFLRHIGHFSPPSAMPTALAPAILASWPTSEPTGLRAAATTTVSPGLDLPIRVGRAQ